MVTIELGLLLVGCSLAGFWDAWFIHHLLGWHHMYCVNSDCLARSADEMRLMEMTDAAFHALMWVTNISGIAAILRALIAMGDISRLRWHYIVGKVLQGSGSFQVVEGIIDHFVLRIHRVNPRSAWPGPLALDILFLLVGGAMYCLGWGLSRHGALSSHVHVATSASQAVEASTASLRAQVGGRHQPAAHHVAGESTAERVSEATEVHVRSSSPLDAEDEERVRILGHEAEGPSAAGLHEKGVGAEHRPRRRSTEGSARQQG